MSKQADQGTSKQAETRPQKTRWTTLRSPVSMVIFLVVVSLMEFGIVLYVLSLGLQDTSALRWTFQFPGTGSPVTLSISPLLHLTPISVVITLGFCWAYLAKKTAVKRQEIHKGRVESSQRQRTEKKGFGWKISRAGRNYSRRVNLWLSRNRVVVYLSRASVKSAIVVLLIFSAFVLLFMLFAYPQLIYDGVSNAYGTNLGLKNFVLGADQWVAGAAQALGPIGWIASALNGALLSAAPTIGYIGSSLGALIAPLATLDNMGKFLVLQNAAVWISVFFVLVYGERAGRVYKYKK